MNNNEESNGKINTYVDFNSDKSNQIPSKKEEKVQEIKQVDNSVSIEEDYQGYEKMSRREIKKLYRSERRTEYFERLGISGFVAHLIATPILLAFIIGTLVNYFNIKNGVNSEDMAYLNILLPSLGIILYAIIIDIGLQNNHLLAIWIPVFSLLMKIPITLITFNSHFNTGDDFDKLLFVISKIIAFLIGIYLALYAIAIGVIILAGLAVLILPFALYRSFR